MSFCKISSQLEIWNHKTIQTPKTLCEHNMGGNHNPLPTTSVPGTRHTLQTVGWNGGATHANGNRDLKLGRYIYIYYKVDKPQWIIWWVIPLSILFFLRTLSIFSRCCWSRSMCFFLQTNRDWVVASIFKLFVCKFLLIFFIPNSITDLDVAAIFTQVESSNKYLGGGNSNIFYFHPDPWSNDPIWLIFLNWVGSTTNQFLSI